jgi:hypothetical protein
MASLFCCSVHIVLKPPLVQEYSQIRSEAVQQKHQQYIPQVFNGAPPKLMETLTLKVCLRLPQLTTHTTCTCTCTRHTCVPLFIAIAVTFGSSSWIIWKAQNLYSKQWNIVLAKQKQSKQSCGMTFNLLIEYDSIPIPYRSHTNSIPIAYR